MRVHALPPTIAALRQHVFNNVIWPDFTRLPSLDHPVLSFVPIEVGQVVSLGARSVEVLSAAHTVPACGYAVSGAAGGAWVYTGDTGPNPALWKRLAAMQVEALVIETAFRDDEHALARISQHLCPERLREELAHLREPMDVFITHIKPGEVDAVMSEIGAQSSHHRIQALVSGQLMPLPR